MASVVVVGSGVAGLIAALSACDSHDVTLVTKSVIRESNTFYAQGGVAAALWQDDTVEAHVQDTLRAGAGLCDTDAVRVLCTEGPDRIRQLIRLGVPFDRTNGGLARGREAAHSNARILHAGGDATGAAIETTLVRAVTASRVTIIENTFLTDLVTAEGRVVGVDVRDSDGIDRRIDADAVILASGGAGQLFQFTTNPLVATGDGMAAAWRSGAQLADLEFYQFHPTTLAVPGNFLVSEAVRGEGAVLRNRAGERFMLDVHPDAELAPRDVVARAISIEMSAQDGEPVMLDATSLGRAFLAERFPTIDAAARRAGFDWSRETLPITPAAHYSMGGVATDLDGRASVPGLYAVGEVASTGAHGANRLASNSLLESVVFAHRAGSDLDRWFAQGEWMENLGFEDEPSNSIAQAEGAQLTGTAVAQSREDIRRLMWDQAGLRRTGSGLQSAADALDNRRSGSVASAFELETENLAQLGRLVVAASLARQESRGAHYRADFPVPQANSTRHRWVRKVTVPC